MARRRSNAPKKSATGGRSKRRRWRLPTGWLPNATQRRRWWRRYRSSPLLVQIIVGAVSVVVLWLAANWIYQVIRKPSELFFPVSGVLYKTPSETWRDYEPIFRKHSTSVMTPDLLAALAQVEGSGNPIVRTYWRWSFTPKPFEVYRPASSAVGMYQITDGTFEESKRYCIHDHVVVEDGPWDDWRSCWFNSLYARVVPSHAVEMTSAYLHRRVESTLRRRGLTSASLQQKQHLATLIHLCGAGAGERYARRGLKLAPGQRCGDHDARGYLRKVDAMKRVFREKNEGTGD